MTVAQVFSTLDRINRYHGSGEVFWDQKRNLERQSTFESRCARTSSSEGLQYQSEPLLHLYHSSISSAGCFAYIPPRYPSRPLLNV